MRYNKSEMGHKVLKDRSVSLTPRQRSLFILFDGKKSLAEILKATLPMGVTQDDVDLLIEHGLIQPVQPVDSASPLPPVEELDPAASAVLRSTRSPQQRYQDAYPIATRLTAGLGLKGFRLNLAVEAAANYDELKALAPKIRDMVGPQQCTVLDFALDG